MIAATIDVRELPGAVLTRAVPVFTVDEVSGESTPTGSAEILATYCWRFRDTAGKSFYVTADADLWTLARLEEDQDAGDVAGWISKVDPRTGEVRYGGPTSPTTVRRTVVDRWRAAGILVPATIVDLQPRTR